MTLVNHLLAEAAQASEADEAPNSAGRERDAATFGAIYQHHARAVYAYAYTRLGQREDAEDAMCQTFAQAWAAFRRYHDRGVPVQAWLYRIATNVVIDAQRRRRVRAATRLDVDESILSYLPDSSPLPEEVTERKEVYERLQVALRCLSSDHRQVVALRFGLGLSTAETSRVMGRSEGAVKALLHRAVKALRQRMQDETPEAQLVDGHAAAIGSPSDTSGLNERPARP